MHFLYEFSHGDNSGGSKAAGQVLSLLQVVTRMLEVLRFVYSSNETACQKLLENRLKLIIGYRTVDNRSVQNCPRR